jgi:putative Mg2+ transporter-C (MgtC) family protein
MMDIWDFLARVAMGAGLSALIGLEREMTGKPAGLRTHAMVGLGASLFTIMSVEGFGTGDPARVAAQIVTGIGFLGAGAIFRSGPLVQGLTTAAGLWAAAAVGMTAGAGRMAWAALATLVAVVVLNVLRSVDRLVSRSRAGTVIEIDVAPVARFMAVRDQLMTIDPLADFTDMATGADLATMTFVVGPERAAMLCQALGAMEDVVDVRRPGGSSN